jgi:hypothetical protein
MKVGIVKRYDGKCDVVGRDENGTPSTIACFNTWAEAKEFINSERSTLKVLNKIKIVGTKFLGKPHDKETEEVTPAFRMPRDTNFDLPEWDR